MQKCDKLKEKFELLTPCSAGTLYVWTNFTEGSIQINAALPSDQFYPVLKHFYPDGSVLIQDDKALMQTASGVTKWFNEYEKCVFHMLWLSHLSRFNPAEHSTYGKLQTSSALHHHHHQNDKWEKIFWTHTDPHPLLEFQRRVG